MDYGYVLKRAWEIIWKFKILWIFGILASCGQASTSGGSNSGYRFSIQDRNLFPQWERFFNQPDPALVALMIGLGILFVLVVIVVFDGRGRPLRLPGDPGRRREQLKKWLWTVGG